MEGKGKRYLATDTGTTNPAPECKTRHQTSNDGI